jgi:uncharacterized membrane protein
LFVFNQSPACAAGVLNYKMEIPQQLRAPLATSLGRGLALAGLLLLGGLTLFAPWVPADKAALTYGVCHQIPTHTLHLAGRPLPLCARCTGTYLGAFGTLAGLCLLGKRRAAHLPVGRVLVVLGVFILAWAVDGLNSYLSLFPGFPYLYEPRNALRLATGTLEGLALASVLYPAFNFTVWREPEARPAIGSLRELLMLVAGAAVLVVAAQAEPGFLLYPLTVLSLLAVLTMLTMVNSMAVAILTRRDGQAGAWRDVWPTLVWGLALTFVELTGIGLFRAILTARLGLPF